MNIFSIQSTIDQLENMFEVINEAYYKNALSKPKILICVLQGENQHSRYIPNVYESITGQKSGEIAIDRDYIYASNINAVFAEMLLCCIKHYAFLNKIKITSNQGRYYNKRFFEVATEHGLLCKKGKYGFSDIQLNHFSEYLLEQHEWGLLIVGEKYVNGATPPAKRNSYRRYVCPKCGLIARTTKDAKLIYGDCLKEMMKG